MMDTALVLRHLEEVNTYIKLPEEAARGVQTLWHVIAADPDFEAKLGTIEAHVMATGDGNPDALTALAAEKGVARNMLLLTAIELFSIPMKERYEANGRSLDVWRDSLLDITIWAKVCFARTGRWGLIEYGWLVHAMVGQVVRLGRLQFEPVAAGPEEDGRVIDGVMLRTGMPMINIHIPEGDPITAEKRLDAYRRAYRFFGKNGRVVFTCHSWLLFEKHYEFLPAGSNIIGFMNDFKLISEDTAYGNGDMWRLFGTAWRDGMTDFDALPQDTGLRRAYVDFFKRGGVGGMSRGYFVFDGERIARE